MILILGGTADAREIAHRLTLEGRPVHLTTVTDYGGTLASEQASVRVGALDEATLSELAASSDAVIDATHPFAQMISRMAIGVCDRLGSPYVRYERPETDISQGIILVDTAEQAAAQAARISGSGVIFLTVGSKTLGAYLDAARPVGARVVARVLPTVAVLEECDRLGLQPCDIVGMQGPTTKDVDVALLRHFQARALVTKESGPGGGVDEKLRAAEEVGVPVVMVRRPAVPYPVVVRSVEELVRKLDEMLGHGPTRTSTDERRRLGPAGGAPCRTYSLQPQPLQPQPQQPAPPPGRLKQGLIQVYTGNGKGKTTAAIGQALRARGAGLSVCFVQFIKGGKASSELEPLRALGIQVIRPANVPTGLLRNGVTDEDRRAARDGWDQAKRAIGSGDWDLIVMDELHAALHHGLLETEPVLQTLANRPAHVEIVTTGRRAPAALCAMADLVTEMFMQKHPFSRGVRARRGIEF